MSNSVQTYTKFTPPPLSSKIVWY